MDTEQVVDKAMLKNVKISDHVHKQVKRIASETGINIGKLMEMGAMKVVEAYNAGTFDAVKTEYSKIRRNGNFTRT